METTASQAECECDGVTSSVRVCRGIVTAAAEVVGRHVVAPFIRSAVVARCPLAFAWPLAVWAAWYI